MPDLDLYMDQITTLFADKTQEPDGLLTKTMINNYSKDGLIKPIKGKKYSKEHILQMLLIYRLKQTLSIQQIKGVMQNLSAQVEDQPSEQIWKELYAGYLNSREHNGGNPFQYAGRSSEAHPGGFSGGHGAAAFCSFPGFPI